MRAVSKGVSLNAIAMFEVLSETGSIADTARRIGQSQPAVSQQLQKLETSLGACLVHHNTRPMTLTIAGRTFLARAKESLRQLRLARTEIEMLDLSHLNSLRIGIIEDFDAEITPTLVSTLSQNLSNCALKQVSGPSHEMGMKLDEGQLDILISAASAKDSDRWNEFPLLRDPFILVTPAGYKIDASDPLQSLKELPFLRHDQEMLIARQIEAQLGRMKINLPNRFEIGPIQSMLGLVANGSGWAITTPLSYLRAQRFQSQVAVHPLPIPKFARRISLFCRVDWADKVPGEIAETLRGMLRQTTVADGLQKIPWLAGSYRVID